MVNPKVYVTFSSCELGLSLRSIQLSGLLNLALVEPGLSGQSNRVVCYI